MALKEMGVFWNKENEESGKFLSGTIELVMGFKQNVLIMKNTPAEGKTLKANAPQWKMLLIVPDAEKKNEDTDLD